MWPTWFEVQYLRVVRNLRRFCSRITHLRLFYIQTEHVKHWVELISRHFINLEILELEVPYERIPTVKNRVTLSVHLIANLNRLTYLKQLRLFNIGIESFPGDLADYTNVPVMNNIKKLSLYNHYLFDHFNDFVILNVLTDEEYQLYLDTAVIDIEKRFCVALASQFPSLEELTLVTNQSHLFCCEHIVEFDQLIRRNLDKFKSLKKAHFDLTSPMYQVPYVVVSCSSTVTNTQQQE